MRRIFVAWCVNTKFSFQADYPVHAVTGCWTVGWKLRSQRCWNQRHRCHRSILIHSVIHAKLPLVLRGVRPVATIVGELRYLADLTAETRSEERRVGKECRDRCSPQQRKNGPRTHAMR